MTPMHANLLPLGDNAPTFIVGKWNASAEANATTANARYNVA
jgi:hypothetical protein